jgi:glycosyltransferase involved in cell wall biosynthesis
VSLRIVMTAAYSWPEVRRGGERYLHELSGALADAGHRVRVLSAATRRGRLELNGVPVRQLRRRRLRLGSRFGDLAHEVAFGVQSLGLLGTARADVWHALTQTDALAAALASTARPGLRSVYTDLGVPTRETRLARTDAGLYRRLVPRVDEYVCISEAAAAPLREYWGRGPRVVPPGVDLAAFAPAARHPSPALLFASDADDGRKDLPLLLEAVACLRRRIPDLELWLAGPGDPTRALTAAPPEARAAVTLSRLVDLDELRSRYARAWATVLPSTREAFGLVVVESLASGTPAVVLSGSGGPAEILAGHEHAGAVAEASAEALAEACARAVDLARAGSSTAEACRTAAEPYDWRRGIVPRIEAVYAGTTPGAGL